MLAALERVSESAVRTGRPGQASPVPEKQLDTLDGVAPSLLQLAVRHAMADRCTPNGCSVENGVAIARVEVETDTQTAHVWFTDRSEYRYRGLDWTTLFAWASQDDPGCYFNKFIAPGDYVKLSGPR